MIWDSDKELLGELEAAMRAEREVPARFVEAGKAAFAWRTVDAELAALTADSARDDRAMAGLRAEEASVRAITFATATVTIDVELTPDALFGQVVPARAGELQVCPREGETQTVPVDEVGWFSVRPRPTQTFRLRFEADGEPAVVTEWIVL